MSIGTSYGYDPSTLAWEGDRQSYLALSDEARALLDGISRYLVEDALPHDHELHEGCHSAEDCEQGFQLAELWAAIGELVVVDPKEDGADEAKAALEQAIAEARLEGEKDATIPSRASTAERKAMRLLLERRLVVVRRESKGELEGLIVATCRGENGSYDLGFDPRGQGRWRCTCPELQGNCSHLTALKMVV